MGIGFIQGRLSPMVDGKIQAFPTEHWEDEFASARALDLFVMEWTLDQKEIFANPLMTPEGREKIKKLCLQHTVYIPSLTGDNFMQAPFWKTSGTEREALIATARYVLESCGDLGINWVVVPLVDNGSIDSPDAEANLKDGLSELMEFLSPDCTRIAFESDFGPQELARFMDGLDPAFFGVNYDIGNSAALGFDYNEEIAAYGNRIVNVHVKDRVLGGTTVPLGTGAADLPGCVAALVEAEYDEHWIMQTARAEDGDHAGALARYRDMIAGWIRDAERNLTF